MAQIKYVVFACLLLVTGIFVITVFQRISSTPLVKEKPAAIDFETPAQTTTDRSTTNGSKLFKQNCASCHALDKALSGPALRGVTKRGPWAEDKANFKKWVRNPSAFIPTHPYTIELQKQYGGAVMPAFVALTDEEVDLLYKYLDGPPPPMVKPAPVAMQ
jgi:mono/diheme cytochrome c family protein